MAITTDIELSANWIVVDTSINGSAVLSTTSNLIVGEVIKSSTVDINIGDIVVFLRQQINGYTFTYSTYPYELVSLNNILFITQPLP